MNLKRFTNKEKNIHIKAKSIEYGSFDTFSKNVDIKINGVLKIGDRSRFGENIRIRGNNITFGNDLFCSGGLEVGGGGSNYPNSNLVIGDRCTIHNNHINLCESVIIGDDVGLSPEVTIMSHGYWLSVLKGFPAKFKGVNINSGVIVGWRSIILMGVNIGKCVVIGAGSIVTKDLKPYSVYAGNPAKFIRKITPLTNKERIKKVEEMLEKYSQIADYHGIQPYIHLNYPLITVNECIFNVETLTFEGDEDIETDDFRDYVRKWGLRFYSDRPFKSVWSWDNE